METTEITGLIDLQVNGFGGVDFNDVLLSKADVETACKLLADEDVAGFLPTLITNSFENIEALAAVILSADDSCGAKILGLHLEGPFISPQDGARGAHPPEFIRPPSIDFVKQLQDKTDGKIRIVTFSPEWDNAAIFTEQLRLLGIHPAIGHTSATQEQIEEVVDAGADLSTHLGNGIQPMLPRHPNPIWSQLADDRLAVSLIGDGFHLPREVFQTVLKVKGKKAFLVSDSTKFAGMKPGKYQTHIGGDVILTEQGQLHLEHDNRLLAGSAMSLKQIVQTLVMNGWLSYTDALEMASVRPLEFLNFELL
ncbi:MAG: N-acetylglucosamine-6-phosphate deacetylase [Planctomycetaceae bacterium]|nr:N-acetylglucosamine-6-phosphate deacetylase [Planctomycetaceae bacterium]